MPKVSDAHKELVRQRLLDAAGTVIMRDGHEGATTRAIVAEAGLSAGALYTYFSSKEELFEQLAERSLDLGLVRQAVDAGEDEDPVAPLRRFAEELLTVPDLPALTWFRSRMTTDPDVCAANGRFNQHVVSTFSPVISEISGLRPGPDPEALVELFDVIVEGINKRHVLGTFATSFERVGAVALALLVNAITQDAITQEAGR